MRILLAEDDALIGDGVSAGLKLCGHAEDWVRDGESALRALFDHEYEACILDLGLPRCDGLNVLRRARERGLRLPVLVLTARDAREDKIAGLDGGADDYLTKPFDLDELQARLRALVRRAAGESHPRLRHGRLELEPASRQVWFDGQLVVLSAREYALLDDLMRHKQQIRSRAQLEESLYAWGEEAGSNIVEVYVHHLRRKFGRDIIQTVRGMGYRLAGEV